MAIARVTVSTSALTTATTAYTANDQLGTILTLASAGTAGEIWSLTLLDKAFIVGATELFFFTQSVTLAADNAAFAISDADMAYCLGSVVMPIGSSAVNNYHATRHGVGLGFTTAAGDLFVAIKTLAAHTFFGANTDIVVTAVVNNST
jgi:hypothetical protein